MANPGSYVCQQTALVKDMRDKFRNPSLRFLRGGTLWLFAGQRLVSVPRITGARVCLQARILQIVCESDTARERERRE